MRTPPDVVALVVGLVGLLIALVGLWGAFATVNWGWVFGAAPVLLVVCGLVGLFASRSKP